MDDDNEEANIQETQVSVGGVGGQQQPWWATRLHPFNFHCDTLGQTSSQCVSDLREVLQLRLISCSRSWGLVMC